MAEGNPPREHSVVMILNLQNEIVHPDGHIGTRGNAARVRDRDVLAHTATVLTSARACDLDIFYVGNAYRADYDNLNRTVKLFAEHERQRRLQLGTWGTEFHAEIAPLPGETVIYRAGIGSFANSDIGRRLPVPTGTHVYVAGVSTRLVVEAAVFELTDRGYRVTVLGDCCAAASDAAHEEALQTLSWFADIGSSSDFVSAFGSARTRA